MISEDIVIERLEELGFKKTGMVLESIEWLAAQAPAGALNALTAYRLIDPSHTPVRDQAGRNWIPVLVAGDDLLVDASPAMLDLLLAGSGYFDQPEAFGDLLLTQFHRLALDFYQGYQVREQSFEYQDGELVIQGNASRGAGHGLTEWLFKTTIRRNQPAQFELEESPSQRFR